MLVFPSSLNQAWFYLISPLVSEVVDGFYLSELYCQLYHYNYHDQSFVMSMKKSPGFLEKMCVNDVYKTIFFLQHSDQRNNKIRLFKKSRRKILKRRRSRQTENKTKWGWDLGKTVTNTNSKCVECEAECVEV